MNLKFSPMRFSQEEISQLFKAWFAISLAFTIARGGLGTPFFVRHFLLSGLTVGVAFLAHELAHKFVAQRFGCFAEFRAFDLGLLLAVLMSFSGFIFAAPGAVVIAGLVSRAENGKIATAGPLTNIVLALLFWFSTASFRSISLLSDGFTINAWLAFFNLLPFWQLDGLKILNWSRGVWILLILTAGALIFLV